jgi:predicted transcriptional regulator of viral defense system
MQALPRATTGAKLAGIAEDQWGLLTRRQAERAGISPATFQRLSSGGTLQREAHGVYRLAGAPIPDHASLRSAWLQLAPDALAWERGPEQGVVSHRSAAAMYGLGHLPADVHEFTLPVRRQVRRPDVRVHRGKLGDDEWITLRGLPVTRPARTSADLLADREDPEAVGHVVADALREVKEYPRTFVEKLGPHAAQLGLRRGDGVAVLRWLLDLVGDPETPRWMQEARAAWIEETPEPAERAPSR